MKTLKSASLLRYCGPPRGGEGDAVALLSRSSSVVNIYFVINGTIQFYDTSGKIIIHKPVIHNFITSQIRVYIVFLHFH